MILRDPQGGLMYGCSRYPACRGTHGAYRDGSPYGTPADGETKKLRIRTHELFDQLWRHGLDPRIKSLQDPEEGSRDTAYRWLRQALDLGKDQAHIGSFSKENCERAIRLLKELGLREEDDDKLDAELLRLNAKYGLMQTADFDPLLDPCWVEILEGPHAGKTGWCFNLEGPEYPDCHGETCGEVTLNGDPGSKFIPLKWLRKAT